MEREMTPLEQKIAKHRLRALELEEALGNVSEKTDYPSHPRASALG